MDVWTVLSVDFLSVFGRVLGAILAFKINEKCIKQLSKVLVDFHDFLIENTSQMGGLGDPKIETFRAHFMTLSLGPGTPPGKQMEPKWSQNGAKMKQNGTQI